MKPAPGDRCQYCGDAASVFDHILPKSQGGTNTLTNLAAACRSCNSAKGPRTPQQWIVSLWRKWSTGTITDRQHHQLAFMMTVGWRR